jgi:hypothetical protein
MQKTHMADLGSLGHAGGARSVDVKRLIAAENMFAAIRSPRRSGLRGQGRIEIFCAEGFFLGQFTAGDPKDRLSAKRIENLP